MAKTIHKINSKKLMLPLRKRVAAYARVSSGKDAMLHSLSAQVSYYSWLIQNNPEWSYAGVYADEAITGTRANREQFQKMLTDARAGKLDMIITKSISRFARNTVTLLETVRELKQLGVDVYFEEQNIHSMSGDGELMLTILASFAQEESRSVSENCKWRIRKEFAAGNPVTWRFMYGYRIHKGKITIHLEEAAIVRWIFDSYVAGIGTAEIARILRENNVPSYRGGMWSPNRIVEILKNEKYAGNSLLQKEFTVDHLTKARARNRGELPMYFAEGTHPAIVSAETFEAALHRLERNRLANKTTYETPKQNTFTGMIICDQCGKRYKRVTRRGIHSWNCDTYMRLGKSHCHTKQIPEDILMQTTASVLGMKTFDATVMTEKIAEIHVPAFNHLTFILKDGTTDERIWQDKTRRDSWTPEMKKQAAEYARRRYTT